MNRRPLLSAIVTALIIASSLYAVGMSPPVYTDKVIGPASSTDNAVMLFDGTTGKIAKDSYITVVEGAGTKQVTVSADATDDDINFDLDADTAADTALFRWLANGVVQAFTGYYGAGPILVFHGEDAIGAAASIPLSIKSGDTAGGASGDLTAKTGDIPSGAGNSGVAGLETGNVDAGDSGGAQVVSGTSVSGGTGVLLIASGDAGVDSGNVTIQTGTAGGTRGDVIINSPNWSVDAAGVILGYKSLNQIVATPYLATASDEIITVDVVGASVINLPTAVGIAGRVYVVKRLSGPGLNIVAVTPSGGETIDGVSPVNMTIVNQILRILSDGTNWIII